MKNFLRILIITTVCLLSVSAFSIDEVCCTTGTPPPPTDWTTIQSYNNPGSQSQQYYSNMNAMYTQRAMEEAKKKEQDRQKCKTKMVTDLNSCNERARLSHASVTSACTIVKWTAIPIAAAATWAGIEGEAAGTVILGAGAAAVYQIGDSCQTNTDRSYTASLASCGVKQLSDEIKCDAIK